MELIVLQPFVKVTGKLLIPDLNEGIQASAADREHERCVLKQLDLGISSIILCPDAQQVVFGCLELQGALTNKFVMELREQNGSETGRVLHTYVSEPGIHDPVTSQGFHPEASTFPVPCSRRRDYCSSRRRLCVFASNGKATFLSHHKLV